MNEGELLKIVSSFGGGVGVIYLLAKAGLLKLSIGAGKSQDEVNGRVEAKLEDMCERIDQIMADIKVFSGRLSQHLRDEEAEVRETKNEVRGMREELRGIKEKMK